MSSCCRFFEEENQLLLVYTPQQLLLFFSLRFMHFEAIAAVTLSQFFCCTAYAAVTNGSHPSPSCSFSCSTGFWIGSGLWYSMSMNPRRFFSHFSLYVTSIFVASPSPFVGVFFGRSTFKTPFSTLAATFEGTISSGKGTFL
jgi:hypothetical protein